MKRFGMVVISASLIASLCACNGLNININDPEDKDLGNSFANVDVNAANPDQADNPDSTGSNDPDNQAANGSESGEPSVLLEADNYPQYWVYPNYENYEFVTNADGSERRTVSVTFSNVEINSGEYNGFPNEEIKNAVNKLNEDTKSGLEEELKNLSDMYNELSADLDEDSSLPTLCTNVYDGVLRADKQVFSIIRESESYYGGAHGTTSYRGISFETATGNEIKFNDVVKNSDGLEDVIAEYLRDNYDNGMFFATVDSDDGSVKLDMDALKKDISDYLDAPDAVCFSITNEGIIIYFNEYHLTSYVAGHQEVMLKYKDYPQYLDGKYFENADEEYIVKINKYLFYPMQFADGDKYVSFNWEKTYNEEYDFYSDTYNIMHVCGGPNWSLDQDIILAGSFIDPELFLIKKGGKEFLYVQNHYFDGVDVLQVFELGDNKLVELKEYSGGVNIESNELKDISYSENLVFANNFEFGYADVTIEDNGLLSDIDQFTYTIYENWQDEYYYTVKFNIDAYEADENNKPTSKKTTLKAGTKVIIVATDGETYWTLLGDDDKTYSIKVKSDGYGGYTMNDNSLDTYFAGNYYY